MGLKFKVAELERQLRDIESIAKKFLDRGSENKLTQVADDLKRIAKRSVDLPWQIDWKEPLKTKPSWGSCESDGRGRYLQGYLSFIWTLRGGEGNTVELVDKASTVLTIHEIERNGAGYHLKYGEEKWLLKWNIDIVTSAEAPGPGIHAQVMNPENLPVPRLPAILFSPADCLDFFLGELFQQEWPQQQSRHPQTPSFARSQQRRLQLLLEEHVSWLNNIGQCSAWTSLKTARPRDDIFVSR